jgi:hypothetical protein
MAALSPERKTRHIPFPGQLLLVYGDLGDEIMRNSTGSIAEYKPTAVACGRTGAQRRYSETAGYSHLPYRAVALITALRERGLRHPVPDSTMAGGKCNEGAAKAWTTSDVADKELNHRDRLRVAVTPTAGRNETRSAICRCAGISRLSFYWEDRQMRCSPRTRIAASGLVR